MFLRGHARLRSLCAFILVPTLLAANGLLVHSQDVTRHRAARVSDRPAQSALPVSDPLAIASQLKNAINATTFDIQSARPVLRDDGVTTVELVLNDEPVTIEVRPHRLRTLGFDFTSTDARSRRPRTPPPSHTYQGVIRGLPNSMAAFSIRDGRVTGVIDDGAGLRWIQPASAFVDGVADDAHVIVNQFDLLPDGGACGTDLMGLMPAPQALSNAARMSGTSSCLSEVEIAIDCDYEFWELEGFSEETLIADVESVVNAMDAIYRQDTGITYRITHLNYWTDQLGDPYITTNYSQMLDEFQNWWNTREAGVQRDIAHMMTGKEIEGNVIGVAYLGAICDSVDGYGLSQSLYTDEFSRRVALTSHELGHNWNACHCNQSGCTGGTPDADCAIMCSSISGCTQTHTMFNQRSIDAITAWRDSAPCLSAADAISVAIARLPAATPGGDDAFGQSVAFSGEWAVIGAPGDDQLAPNAGAAYIFQLQGGVWVQMQKLTAPTGANGDAFGFSVDIDNNFLIISAPLSDRTSPLQLNVGAAHVYRLVETTWTFDEKIDPIDPNANDQFGASVAISGQRVVIGSYLDDDHGNGSGSAYVFNTNNTNWFFQGKLVPVDGAPNDQFGIAVDIDGDDIVVGSWRADAPAFDSGAGYVFHFDGAAWIEQDKLPSPDADVVDQFGRDVAISGGIVIIGAPGDDEAGSEWGAAYAFTRSGSDWMFSDKLMPSLVSDIAQFGISVGLDQETAIIGAWRDDLLTNDAGSVFLFQRQLGWNELNKFTAPVPEELERFGASVAIGGGVVLVGATLTDTESVDSGSAYASAVQTSTEDCNENGTADGCEIALGFAADINANGIPDECECLADINLNGTVDVTDLLTVLAQWGACTPPCPPLCAGDIDGNCLVNVSDLLNVLSKWGPCPETTPLS